MRMQSSQEKLCLQWNDFQVNISSAFRDLKDDRDFTDVTLACEDGQQVEAHKVVLISSSPFFLNLLKMNKHPHPLIYMRGLKHDDLVSIMDFLYYGEANVFQENLDSFLGIADELQLKGLKKENKPKEEEIDAVPVNSFKGKTTRPSKSRMFSIPSKTVFDQEDENKGVNDMEAQTEIAILQNNSDPITDVEEVNQKVKSMMTFSVNLTSNQVRRARVCKVCGKEGEMGNIMNHIEANHMTNISIPCDKCGKTLYTRNALNQHKPRCRPEL